MKNSGNPFNSRESSHLRQNIFAPTFRIRPKFFAPPSELSAPYVLTNAYSFTNQHDSLPLKREYAGFSTFLWAPSLRAGIGRSASNSSLFNVSRKDNNCTVHLIRTLKKKTNTLSPGFGTSIGTGDLSGPSNSHLPL